MRTVCLLQENNTMKKLIFSTLLVAMLLTGESAFAQVSIGIRIGPPPPPRVIRVLPRRPGLAYVWVDGYWYPNGRKYKWHQGYWTLPPYEGARWIAPHYDGQMFFQGYWEGNRGRLEHDHHTDRDRDRDHHEDRHRR